MVEDIDDEFNLLNDSEPMPRISILDMDDMSIVHGATIYQGAD